MLLLVLAACSGPATETPPPAAPPALEEPEDHDASELPPTARRDLIEEMAADKATPRSTADGQGTARLVSGEPGQAGWPGRWQLEFTAGPEGVAEGGAVYLQTGPFWGWSTPQTQEPDLVGYTEVSTAAEGVLLRPETVGQGLLAVHIEGRALAPGETLTLDYGAGPMGAVADRYAESASPFWIAVDGDGDGVRKVIAQSPTVAVVAGPAARLSALLPSTAVSGTPIPLTIAALDATGSAGTDLEGPVQIEVIEGSAELEPATLGPGGRTHTTVTPTADGILRLRLTAPGGLSAETNPTMVGTDQARILWGDLHGHSAISDGTGTPADYFGYARDIAALDVIALTDHDRWGLQPLVETPALWEEIQTQTRAFHEPGRFVTLLGYEWTSWIHGHRHVLFFGDEGTVCDSTSPDCAHPEQLWSSLRGQDALTLTHHQAGGPVATNWDIPPDPVLEPLAEVTSVHGNSEARDAPRFIYDPVAGTTLRDALDRGYRLGFVGSGDSHDGHPGLAHLASGTGGVAAILAEEPTRASVLEALRARRAYATSGPRIILRTSLAGRRMGSEVPVEDAPALVVLVVGTAPVSHIDVIVDGEVLGRHDCELANLCRLDASLPTPEAGGYAYVRAVQTDEGTAWSSPFFFVAPPEETPKTP